MRAFSLSGFVQDTRNAIIVRREIKSSLSLEKMRGMKIAVAKDFAIHEFIKKIADYANALCFASRKNWPILNQILDKGLTLIIQAEKDDIMLKLMPLRLQSILICRLDHMCG